jgi:hypothetical protein
VSENVSPIFGGNAKISESKVKTSIADVAELADALDSGSSGHYALGGSSPLIRIRSKILRNKHLRYLLTFSSAARIQKRKTVNTVLRELGGSHHAAFIAFYPEIPEASGIRSSRRHVERQRFLSRPAWHQGQQA